MAVLTNARREKMPMVIPANRFTAMVLLGFATANSQLVGVRA